MLPPQSQARFRDSEPKVESVCIYQLRITAVVRAALLLLSTPCADDEAAFDTGNVKCETKPTCDCDSGSVIGDRGSSAA